MPGFRVGTSRRDHDGATREAEYLVDLGPTVASEETPAGGSGAGDGLRRFLTHGVYNGDFSLAPEKPLEVADDDNNPLPWWSFVRVLGTVPDVLVDRTVAGGVSFTMRSGAASDEAYLQQVIDFTPALKDTLALTFSVGVTPDGAPNLMEATVSVEVLDAALNVLGTAYGTNSATTVSLPATVSRLKATIADTADGGTASQPAFLRLRVGFARGAEAAAAVGTVYVTDARLERTDLALPFAVPGLTLGTVAAEGSEPYVIRSDATVVAFDVTAPTTSAVGDAAAVGVIAKAARRDHKHGRESFATPAIVLGTAAAAGVATTPIRSDSTIVAFDATVPAAIGTAAVGAATVAPRRDHVHPTGAGTPSTQAIGDAAAVGTGPAAAMTDHKHAMPAFAAPGLTLGTANAAGAAATLIRTDATILAFDVTNPSTQAFADAAAVGVATTAPRRDHKHAMMADPVTAHVAAADPHTGYVLESLLDAKGDLISASAADTPILLTAGANDTILMADSAAASGLKWVASASPSAVGTAAVTGTADTFTRGDHVHAHEAAHIAHDTIWDAKGDLAAGTAADTAAALTVGANDTILMADSAAASGLKWVASATPSTQAFADAAAVGTADTFTRGDHKHAMPADPTSDRQSGSGYVWVKGISIIPVANTPTSGAVGGLSLSGTNFYGIASPSSTVPGSKVTETSTSSVTGAGATMWIYRSDTTATTVNYIIWGV